jgi:hypothetical protein
LKSDVSGTGSVSVIQSKDFDYAFLMVPTADEPLHLMMETYPTAETLYLERQTEVDCPKDTKDAYS